MRILCVADAVAPELLEPDSIQAMGRFDFLASCGDLPPEYLSRLRHRFNAPLYYVKGNHDIRYEQAPPQGCQNIHERVVRHGGLKILGLEGSHWYNGGPNQYTERQMRAMVRALRLKLWYNRGADIILTHAPPRHINDQEDQCHMGFEVFRTLIERYHPRFFLHGHIHRSFGHEDERISLQGQTRVINCFGFHIIEFDEKHAV